MTPQERNEVLEEAAMHMELCAGHYCAKKVRELKKMDEPTEMEKLKISEMKLSELTARIAEIERLARIKS